MVAERSLDAQVVVVDVAFKNEFRVGGHLEVDGLAADEAHRTAPQEARERDLVDHGRQGSRRGVRDRRIGADDHGDRCATAPLGGMRASLLVPLPVHGRRRAVVDLDAVDPDVLRSGLWVFRDDEAERDERTAVERPRLQDGKRPQVGVALDDLLDRRVLLDRVGNRCCERAERDEFSELPLARLRDSRLDRAPDPRPDLVEAPRIEGHRHAPLRPELVGEDGKLRTRDVAEQERRAARLDHPIRDLGDLEVRADARAHFDEFAGASERTNVLA